MTLGDELLAFLKSKGADLIGFADLSEIDSHTRDGFHFGISIGIALNPKIISYIHEGPTKLYVKECQRADELLKDLGNIATEFFRQTGHKAQPRTTTGAEYPDTLSTRLPQKTMTTRAGLGWIGKCALLITQEYGSAVRLGSILTDAELSTGAPVDTSRCQDCTACVTICPAQAITGEEWFPGIDRAALVDVFACRKTARELLTRRTGGEIKGRTFCGMCIAVCPWTQEYLERACQ